ncbi:MAG: hypothetical protein CM15mP109_11440 [Candidatus Dadabacteria bacterium]|nr:MAG: hypothetical protein CM15mP109_11440 [Candidatus Dadabacteria bacterium]
MVHFLQFFLEYYLIFGETSRYPYKKMYLFLIMWSVLNRLWDCQNFWDLIIFRIGVGLERGWTKFPRCLSAYFSKRKASFCSCIWGLGLFWICTCWVGGELHKNNMIKLNHIWVFYLNFLTGESPSFYLQFPGLIFSYF